MKPVLIYARPLDQTTGQRVEVRIGDGLSADEYGTGGVPWQPALTTRPTLSIELMSTDMDGTVQAGKASFEISLRALRGIPNAELLYWKGAQVIIRSTGVLEGPSAVPDFWGYITSGSPDRDTGRLKLNAEVSIAFLDQNLLTLEFTGGGGAMGEPTKRGVLKPAGFGAVPNIEPVWFDLTHNIGMIDGYGNTLSINWLGEGLSSFGAPVADYPTYAALAKAIDDHLVPNGRWATCIAEGMVGLGAPPVGVITCHATFGANRIGAMMKRMLLTHAKVAVDRVDSAAFDQLDLIVPRPVHYWTADQANVKERCEALAASCNATPLVTFQNKVTVTRATASSPVATLDRSGSVAPRVKAWATADVDPPYAQMKARTARPALVLSFDQVNYSDTIVDRGLYYTDTVYRQGNVVYLSNGSKWLYINQIPAAGHNPPPPPNTVDAYWQQLLPPTTAEDITYADGTPIEELKPSAPGADVTGDNTSKDTSAVGGRPAAELIQDVDINTTGLLSAILNGDELNQLLTAVTNIDGQPVSVQFLNFKGQQLGINSSMAYEINLIGAKNEDNTAYILEVNRVQTEKNEALATSLREVKATVGASAASVQLLMEALVSDDGAYSKAILRANADGVFGAVSITASGAERLSRIGLVADELEFVDPNMGNPIKPFSISGGKVRATDFEADTITYGSLMQRFSESGQQNLNPLGGFQQIPGGPLMQWGRYRQTINSESALSVIFPTPFPTACFMFVPVGNIAAANNLSDLWIQTIGTPSRQGGTVYAQAARDNAQNLAGFDWIAFGV